MMRAGLKSGRTLPRAVLDGYDELVAAQRLPAVLTARGVRKVIVG